MGKQFTKRVSEGLTRKVMSVDKSMEDSLIRYRKAREDAYAKARAMQEQLQQQIEAATKIQAVVRGHQTRSDHYLRKAHFRKFQTMKNRRVPGTRRFVTVTNGNITRRDD